MDKGKECVFYNKKPVYCYKTCSVCENKCNIGLNPKEQLFNNFECADCEENKCTHNKDYTSPIKIKKVIGLIDDILSDDEGIRREVHKLREKLIKGDFNGDSREKENSYRLYPVLSPGDKISIKGRGYLNCIESVLVRKDGTINYLMQNSYMLRLPGELDFNTLIRANAVIKEF